APACDARSQYARMGVMNIVVLAGGIGGAAFLRGVRALARERAAGVTSVVKDELAAYGAEPSWFGLGDKDIATHLVRTRMLSAGYPLSAVTAALCARWQPGVTILPASDDRVETHVVVGDGAG